MSNFFGGKDITVRGAKGNGVEIRYGTSAHIDRMTIDGCGGSGLVIGGPANEPKATDDGTIVNAVGNGAKIISFAAAVKGLLS